MIRVRIPGLAGCVALLDDVCAEWVEKGVHHVPGRRGGYTLDVTDAGLKWLLTLFEGYCYTGGDGGYDLNPSERASCRRALSNLRAAQRDLNKES